MDLVQNGALQLASISQPHLSYYGGRIIRDPKFISLYAGGFWATDKGSREKKHLDGCSSSVPSGAHASVWREFGVSPGKFVGSATVPLATSRRVITERDVQGLVADTIRGGGVTKPDGDTVYTLFLPPNVVLRHGEADSRRGLGGFHGSYIDPRSRKPVYYAAIVYADSKNGVQFTSKPLDNISIAATHEWSEAVTDPDVNRGKLGWYDRVFGEIGDIPLNMGFAPSQLWGRLNGCAVQREWSNRYNRPVLSEQPRPGSSMHDYFVSLLPAASGKGPSSGSRSI